MYKNIEVLDKKKHEKIKFDEVDSKEVAKNIGLVPLGFTEVWSAAYHCPVLINSLNRGEFVAFTGISNEVNIYHKGEVYIPAFIRSYPFLSIDIKDENDRLNSVIAIDNNAEYVGKSKKEYIFTKTKELAEKSKAKVELTRELNRQREISRKIVEELKAHDLLLKKDFRVKSNDEEKVLLEEFYIIDIQKLQQLEDKVIVTWAKKGWMGIFDAHLKSLGNFQKILVRK